MRLSFGQEMRQSQKQILAPRMIQSMEILQLPMIALQERIEKELQENEALELAPDAEEETETLEPLPGEEPSDELADNRSVDEKEMVVDESKDNADDFERLINMDEEWPDTYEERSKPSSSRIEEDGDRQHDTMANMVSRPVTLQDHLHEQLGYFELSPEVLAMCDRVIYNLDKNGYVQGRLEDLLDSNGGHAQAAALKEALATVQKLDPPGVGARDLKECLLLQLQPDMELFDKLKTLITSHLEDLEFNRMPIIQKKTGMTLDEIREALDHLRKLKPKPGAEFQSEHVPNVTPDLFIEPAEGGGYKIRLEDTSLPNLYISPYYRQLLQNGQADQKTKEYIKRKIMSAQWLIEAIEQRRNTLTRVAQAIADHQQAFLEKGPEFLEPLKMQQIADVVKVHVTTVSRAVDEKWAATPRGIFPLKRFFVGGTVSADGDEVAWDTVRMKLQEIIDHEDKSCPLSDDELVESLHKAGITVARRTITKYRKAMNIPSSRQRRDWSQPDTAKDAAKAAKVAAKAEAKDAAVALAAHHAAEALHATNGQLDGDDVEHDDEE